MELKELDLEIVRKEHYDELVKYMPHKDKVLWAKTRIKEFLEMCMEHNKKGSKNLIDVISVSFSGGKDSTVLLDLVLKVHHEINCNIPLCAAYAMEITFPSTIKFIRETVKKYANQYPGEIYEEPDLIPPKKPWNEILATNGYPIFSKQVSVLINRIRHAKTKNSVVKWCFGIEKDKTSTSKYKLSESRLFLLDNHMIMGWKSLIENNASLKEYFPKYDEYYFVSEKCCDYVKGGLKHDKRPSFIGVMAQESEMRKKSWIKNGCNIFGSLNKKSRPLSIWTAKDVWQYARDNQLEINPAYNFKPELSDDKQDLIFERLGCTSCPFGALPESKIIERIEKNKGHQNYQEVITDNKYMNRFEKLKAYYPHLYEAQIIRTGMYKIVIDMDVKIRNDPKYMELYYLRRKQIENWYQNKRTNIMRIMAQLENPKDYKNKGNLHIWEFTKKDIEECSNHFGFEHQYSWKEFQDIRKEEQEFFSNNKNIFK